MGALLLFPSLSLFLLQKLGGGDSAPRFSSVDNAQFYQISMEGAFMNAIRSTRPRIFSRLGTCTLKFCWVCKERCASAEL